MSNIEEDIKRCEKLTEPQNANWIGISNQLAIAGALARIQELEEENKRKDMFVEMAKEVIENSILKQKVKGKIEEIKEDKESKYFDKFLMTRDIDYAIEILEELLEDK